MAARRSAVPGRAPWNIPVPRLLPASLALTLLALPAGAAVYDEFEVHGTDLAAPGEWAVDQHLNYGLRGRRKGDFPDALAPNRGLSATTEIARGMAPWWETALYLPMALDAAGQFHPGGAKLRNLFVLAGRGEATSFGLLTEFRALSSRYMPSSFGWEIRPILSHAAGRWTAVATLGFSGGFTGRNPTLLTPALRLDYRLAEDWTLGAEHYADLGPLERPERPGRQAHQAFAVVEHEWRGATLVLGLGHGLTPASDRWVAKLRLGLGF